MSALIARPPATPSASVIGLIARGRVMGVCGVRDVMADEASAGRPSEASWRVVASGKGNTFCRSADLE
eukprot:scaffold6727_cov106-Isochrysis_galbana.AAC.10